MKRAYGALWAMLLTSGVAVTACGSPAPEATSGATRASARSESPSTSTSSATAPATDVPSVTPVVPTSPAIDPGTLPQTQTSPSAGDAELTARLTSLWSAIQSGDDASAHGAFFPLAAYRQIKAVSDPEADYRGRLLTAYDLDLAALRQFVGPGATLQGFDVPTTGATWVLPGQEYNNGPYWRLYGTRVRFTSAAGEERSFGITSLISWRGQWYVVHLGPINRPAGTGAITP